MEVKKKKTLSYQYIGWVISWTCLLRLTLVFSNTTKPEWNLTPLHLPLRTLGLLRYRSSSAWPSGGACRTWSKVMTMGSSSSVPAVTWLPWPSAPVESCRGSGSWRPCTSACVTPSPSPTAAGLQGAKSGQTLVSTCRTVRPANTPSRRSLLRVTYAETHISSETLTPFVVSDHIILCCPQDWNGQLFQCQYSCCFCFIFFISVQVFSLSQGTNAWTMQPRPPRPSIKSNVVGKERDPLNCNLHEQIRETVTNQVPFVHYADGLLGICTFSSHRSALWNTPDSSLISSLAKSSWLQTIRSEEIFEEIIRTSFDNPVSFLTTGPQLAGYFWLFPAQQWDWGDQNSHQQ